jgi:hypothetical protein
MAPSYPMGVELPNPPRNASRRSSSLPPSTIGVFVSAKKLCFSKNFVSAKKLCFSKKTLFQQKNFVSAKKLCFSKNFVSAKTVTSEGRGRKSVGTEEREREREKENLLTHTTYKGQMGMDLFSLMFQCDLLCFATCLVF